MGKLTQLTIKNAKAGRHADGDGLYLLVKNTGAKSWVLRVQFAGKRRDLGIGATSLVGLAEARQRANQWRKLAKQGIDPTQQQKRLRELPTFEIVAREYHEDRKDGWRNVKHAAQWLSTLETYVFPKLGRTRVDLIDASDMQSVLRPIWCTKPETARRVRQRLASVLNYAKAKGWRESEAPLQAVNSLFKGLKQPKGRHFPAMPYDEVPAFVRKLGDGAPTSGREALLLLIHTACRSGEVRFATAGEFDLDSKQWNIPAERMKAGQAHSVPLTPEALAIVRRRLKLVGSDRNRLLFPGLSGRSMSDMTLTKVLRTNGGTDYTVHGFRSSFRDWVAEKTQYPGDWAEAALAHAVPNKTEAAYRRTKYLEQRRSLMADWSVFLRSDSPKFRSASTGAAA